MKSTRWFVAALLVVAPIAWAHYYFTRPVTNPVTVTTGPTFSNPVSVTQWFCVTAAGGTVSGPFATSVLAEPSCGAAVAADGVTRYLEERVTTTASSVTTTSTRRIEVLGGTTLKISSAHAAFLNVSASGGGSAGGGGGATFDYYISTTGNDNDPGTLAEPWAFTALETKGATIAGATVGLLDGTYRVAATTPTNIGGVNDVWMAIPSSSSGTSGDRTVIAAVNPRQAIITINDGANNYPTGSGNPMGIGVDANYLTFSGLRFSDWHFYAIQVAANEFLIEDSQFDDFNTLKGNIADTNMGAFTSARGTLPLNMTVRNSEFFDIRNDEYTMNSSAVAAFGNFFGMGDTFIAEYNTIYRIGNNNGSALYAKNDSGSIIFRYNYLYDVGGIVFGMGLVDTTEFSGSLYRVHNNVVRAQGFARSSGTEAELVLAQTFEVYNNTFVQTANDGSGNTYWMFGNNNSLSSSGAGNTVKWYNNILRSTGFTVSGGILIQSCCGNAVQVFGGNEDIVDYNLYTAPTFTVPEGNTTSLATWRGYFSNGTDQNTISTAPTFVNASGTAAADFDLQAGSAGENAGSIDGAGGGATDMGAWGGASAPSRIGTDW